MKLDETVLTIYLFAGFSLVVASTVLIHGFISAWWGPLRQHGSMGLGVGLIGWDLMMGIAGIGFCLKRHWARRCWIMAMAMISVFEVISAMVSSVSGVELGMFLMLGIGVTWVVFLGGMWQLTRPEIRRLFR